jgi:hypothetical protein
MKTIALMLASCLFLTSCAVGHHYYDEDWNGSRFYETKSGDRIKVMADGTVWRGDKKLGVVEKKGPDWDLSAYDIQPAYTRCYNPVHWDQTIPCESYLLTPLVALGQAALILAYLALLIGFSALNGLTIKT